MKILCLGNVTYDISFPLENYPIENTKNRTNKIVKCGGGTASNAAYLLGKWGAEVYFAGLLGNDYYGNIIKKEFESVNVRTDYLELRDNINTTLSVALINKSNSSRTIITHKPENLEMKPFKLDFEPDIILIDGQEYERSKEILNRYPHALSIIDAGRIDKKIIELCKMVKWIVCSKDFATQLTNMEYTAENIKIIYAKLKELFKGEIVITLEENGCYYNELIPSITVNSIDSNGAGDIFHGAFTYYLSKAYNIYKVLKLSNIAGAISVTKLGTRNSIPNKEEVEKYEYR